MATASPCRSCGALLVAGARFCHECGRPVESSSSAAEFKQVTVVFADVVRSMDIASTVGPERLREIMSALVDIAAAVVQRYGGTVDKFTGDGIMALFGAPAALEDHALRACRAALDIQAEVQPLAAGVARRDGVDFRIRVGVNSGQVIAGDIGTAAAGYTAVGEQVGMAQRMESVAPAGGVMLSASTAGLVHDRATLGELEFVTIKGAAAPVPARRLLAVLERDRTRGGAGTGVAQTVLVGRGWELAAATGLLDRAIGGHGSILNLVGSPGIGKSRLAEEVEAAATAAGLEVFGSYCESHATGIPFRVITRLLRAATAITGLDPAAARSRVRELAPEGADPEDLLLFDDLLGISDPAVGLPVIDPDARRRRLAALITAALLARTNPAVYVVEDVHWIDAASETMLATYLSVVPSTPSLVILTYRPEYQGPLSRAAAQTIALGPLADADTATLVRELLGGDPSVAPIGTAIAAAAAGNPFFALELVRDLAERGVLTGQRGMYASTADARVSLPVTVQATIAARIDRLPAVAKRALGAAAVIGSRCSPELLEALGVEPALDDLVDGEFLDQIGGHEYEFHHPLIRTVAYEAQLKADRADLHRRVASAVQARGTPDADAALIAEHVEAAGDSHAAYGWHMRAAARNTKRDITAAAASWQRAQHLADALPSDDPARTAMRIAPRAMLCGVGWRIQLDVAGPRFDELRELCEQAGDKTSLALGMTGLVADHAYRDRIRQSAELADQTMTLLESTGNPDMIVGTSQALIYAKIENAEWTDVLNWSQRVIDLAEGDPLRANYLVSSPLACATAGRGLARATLGQPGFRDDFRSGLGMARDTYPLTYAVVSVTGYIYAPAIPHGYLAADDLVIGEIEDALGIAERAGDDMASTIAQMTLGFALVHRHSDADRARGHDLLKNVAEIFVRRQHNLCDLPGVQVFAARERARSGDRDSAIPIMRAAVEHTMREGRLLGWTVAAAGVFAETLIERCGPGDLDEAEAVMSRVEAIPANGWVAPGIILLRLHALLARARGKHDRYLDYRDRYRAMAKALDYQGHIEWAEALP